MSEHGSISSFFPKPDELVRLGLAAQKSLMVSVRAMSKGRRSKPVMGMDCPLSEVEAPKAQSPFSAAGKGIYCPPVLFASNKNAKLEEQITKMCNNVFKK